jgi:proton-dependent oligopeptide transporter, POT family
MKHRTSPADLEGMPPGIPHIIGNEAAERFSFYGMKAILAVFMVSYLHLMDGRGLGQMNEAEATAKVHLFNGVVYLTPLLGALLADIFLGKYRTIIALSIVYCAGHAALACMGLFGNSPVWLTAGLGLIALGSGGIKPCVSAHVGDQFGSRNAHLLPRIFNWFYFSINLGAFASMLLTPWLLEWHGPHWAFGVPGVLMALATLVFWLGRHRFIHVPAGGRKFFRELFSATGIGAVLKLLPLYIFVAMFWALFDQTGSTWIFQAQDMDRSFLGFEWLPSQIQSLNSVFVLTFIPLFSYLLYPAISRVWTLTPLRKIGLGLFIMVTSFALVALIQEWIDAGQRPNVLWQIAAYALLTAAEVMVSIVALEYAYTQAPRTMKSLLMCLYLGAVAMGNFFVAGVNYFIQIPDSAAIQLEQRIAQLPPGWQSSPRNIVLEGYDGVTGTDDDLIQRVADGVPTDLELPQSEAYEKLLQIFKTTAGHNSPFPKPDQLNAAVGGSLGNDPWGNPIRYERLNHRTARLISNGPDRKPNTSWDIGYLLTWDEPAHTPKASWSDHLHPEKPWIERQKEKLGIHSKTTSDPSVSPLKIQAFSGGQTKLTGTAYFRFFTWLMLATAVLFVPYALLYRPKTYLQE